MPRSTTKKIHSKKIHSKKIHSKKIHSKKIHSKKIHYLQNAGFIFDASKVHPASLILHRNNN